MKTESGEYLLVESAWHSATQAGALRAEERNALAESAQRVEPQVAILLTHPEPAPIRWEYDERMLEWAWFTGPTVLVKGTVGTLHLPRNVTIFGAAENLRGQATSVREVSEGLWNL